MLRVYLSKNQFESGGTKLEGVRCAPRTGPWGQTYTVKAGRRRRTVTGLAAAHSLTGHLCLVDLSLLTL